MTFFAAGMLVASQKPAGGFEGGGVDEPGDGDCVEETVPQPVGNEITKRSDTISVLEWNLRTGPPWKLSR